MTYCPKNQGVLILDNIGRAYRFGGVDERQRFIFGYK